MFEVTKFYVFIGAIAMTLAVSGQDSLAAGGQGRHHDGGHHGSYGPGRFEKLDHNGDGRLTQEEVDGLRGARAEKFDENGDGRLSLQEYEALWMDAMRERMVDRFQSMDDDGDAFVTTQEFIEPYSYLVIRLDQNDDGELTRDEMHPRGREGGRKRRQ